jgi:PAS domain S-box-containing protein
MAESAHFSTARMAVELAALREQNRVLAERNEALQAGYQQLQVVNQKLLLNSQRVRDAGFARLDVPVALSGDSPAGLQALLPLIASQAELPAHLKAVTTALKVGIFQTDLHGNARYVTDEFLAMACLDRAQTLGTGWLQAVHPEDHERLRSGWRRCMETGEPVLMEFRFLRADSEVIHATGRADVVRDDLGRVCGFVGCVQDLSDYRRSESSFKVKDELNQLIVNSGNDGLMVLSLDGHILHITTPGLRMLEADRPEQAQHLDWLKLWPDDAQPLARGALDTACLGESARFTALGATLREGHRWWDTVLSPISDSHGQTILLLAVSRDITELRQREQEIRELNVQLDQRVRQRTEDLVSTNALLHKTLDHAQELYDKAPCGYHGLNADGLIVEMNQTRAGLAGLRGGRGLGDHELPATHPGRRASAV